MGIGKRITLLGVIAALGAVPLAACSSGPAEETKQVVCQQTRVRPEDDGRDIYIYITTSDHNNATERMEDVFERNLSQFEDYELHFERVESVDALKESMEQAFEEEGDIDAMILAFHGGVDRMLFGPFSWSRYLSMGNAQRQLRGYDACLADDARVLLYSCSVGADYEHGNLALTLHDVLEVDIDAPKRTLIPPDTPDEEWEDQFTLDENGLLTYDYDNWAGYESVVFRGSRYGGAVAPLSYTERESSRPWPDDIYDVDDLFLILREK